MDSSEREAAVASLRDTHIDLTLAIADAVKSLAEDLTELERRYLSLAKALTDSAAGNLRAVEALTEQLDNLEQRVTSVHQAALRAVNLTPKGRPAA